MGSLQLFDQWVVHWWQRAFISVHGLGFCPCRAILSLNGVQCNVHCITTSLSLFSPCRNAVQMSLKVMAIQQVVTQHLPTQLHSHLPSLLGWYLKVCWIPRWKLVHYVVTGSHCHTLSLSLCPSGKLKKPGMHYPVTSDIYKPVLAELKAISASWGTWTSSIEEIEWDTVTQLQMTIPCILILSIKFQLSPTCNIYDTVASLCMLC